ncbi:UNVERIFIED_CONTAM: hypothetical protein K2H54_051681 [Gekko kuhli]
MKTPDAQTTRQNGETRLQVHAHMGLPDGEGVTNELESCLWEGLGQLQDIWEETGICEEQRLEQMQVVNSCIKELLDKMIAKEQSLKNRLLRGLQPNFTAATPNSTIRSAHGGSVFHSPASHAPLSGSKCKLSKASKSESGSRILNSTFLAASEN